MLTEHRREGGNRTTLRCRRCGQRNLGIDIWCSRCGSHLDWEGEVQADRSAQAARRLRSHRSANGNGPRPARLASAFRAIAASGRATMDRGRAALQAERDRRAAAAESAAQEREQRRAQEAAAQEQRRQQEAAATERRGQAAVAVAPIPPRPERPTTVPRLRPPRAVRLPPLKLDAIPGTARALIAILGVLLLATLAIVFTLPGGRTAGRGVPTTATSGGPLAVSLPNSAIPAAIGPAESKSGLPFAGTGGCSSSKGCLKVTQQFDGLNAAVVVFSAGSTRVCATYLYRDAAGWHPITAACAGGQVNPMLGQTDSVRVASGCANARDSASLSGGVVSCLRSGTAVTIDAGPTYASGKLWWHLQKVGWMVQDFLQSS